ncbi:MAG TPA: SDR family NAD(P)-dependent oxidoreductase [Fibrobacteraceae bacterium]|nr:SDR family NAD(P)-dependent oxidoreductase [Fibrobacteraceae bacterium]
MTQRLEGRWALVTGASRGVGCQIVRGLAELGCHLILHSRKREHTAQQINTLRETGIQAISVAGDLSEISQVDAFLNEALSQVPQIDILYNNAGIMAPWRENSWTSTPEDYQRSFAVNVISPVRLCNRLIPLMLQRHWGRVINVTSGIRNEPQLAAYAASKAALDKFVRDFAPSLQGTGVQMNLMDPGWLRTDLGGPNAPNDPITVLPGALVPVLLNDGISGRLFEAQNYVGSNLENL